MPRLPAIIYGVISISCGMISLYVPETLNRPLPNSIDDIVKWPRSLSKEEKRIVRKLNREERNTVINSIFRCCSKKKLKKIPFVNKKERQQLKATTTFNIKNELLAQKNSSLLFETNLKKSQFINSNTEINIFESTTIPSLPSSSSSNSLSQSSSNLSVRKVLEN